MNLRDEFEQWCAKNSIDSGRLHTGAYLSYRAAWCWKALCGIFSVDEYSDKWKLEPLTEDKVSEVVSNLDAAFMQANPYHKQTKSPAEQFSESHQKWVDGGREC